MIELEPGADWRGLQERVAAILGECGLSAEVGRTLSTVRGVVEVDVFAMDPASTPPAVYLCECKRWSTNVPKAEVKSFRTDVADYGAHFGLFISARGFQSGADAVVEKTNVHLLDWIGFQDMFLERWCEQYWIPTVRDKCDGLVAYIDPPSSDACVRLAHGGKVDPDEAVGILALGLWGSSYTAMRRPTGLPRPVASSEIWALRDKYRDILPVAAAEATTLRDLLDSLVSTADEWTRARRGDV